MVLQAHFFKMSPFGNLQYYCKMVAIKKIQSPKKKTNLKGTTLRDKLHERLMRRMAHFQHFTLLQLEKEKEETDV